MDNYHKATPERKDLIEKLLDGAIDLHCHSGPSVMPRSIDHIEVAEEALITEIVIGQLAIN